MGILQEGRVRSTLTVVLWLGAAAVLTVLVVHHMVTMPTGNGVNDSYIYLSATSNFVSHPSHLYDDAHVQVTTSWAAVAFVHPPSGLLPYLPLVPLVRMAGLPVAGSVLSVIDTLALLAAVILAGRRFGLSRLTLGAAALLISFTVPVSSEIGQGQVNALVLLCVVLSMARMPKLDSGVFLGLALAIKPVSVILLLVPLLRRQPMITVVALATLAVLNLPFVPLIGIGPVLFYLGTVLPYFAGYSLRNGSNVSLAFILQRWFGGGPLSGKAPFGTPVPGTLDGIAILWAARLAVVLLWIRAAIDRRVDVAFAVALTLATVPFLSSTIWPHYLIFLFPLALATLAAPQLWARAGGALSLVAMLWQGRGDALWPSIVILWITAGAMVITKLGWGIPVGSWRTRPAVASGS